MTKFLVSLALLVTGFAAQADTILLDVKQDQLYSLYPTYLGASCGGVFYNEEAAGFNAENDVLTLARFWTRCSTGGRGSRVRTIVKLWTFEYGLDGRLLDATEVASCSWLSGSLANPACNLTTDPTAVYQLLDVSGNPVATSGSVAVGSYYRAYVDSATPVFVPLRAPALIGLTEADAVTALSGAGFVPYVTYLVTANYAAGTVFNQSPAVGAVVAAGATIHVYVALPPDDEDADADD